METVETIHTLSMLTNAVVCLDCSRIMTIFETDKGVCPACQSKAVYPAKPGHMIKAESIPDVRRVG